MANKMLIDAAHPEETRVVVLRGKRVEEFDYESAARKQLRGNIYLAKVTRVEPSLQAAFVDYGGNRHGFLAFSEIHPDYYQIPVADRQALLEEEALAEAEDGDIDDFSRAQDDPYENLEDFDGAEEDDQSGEQPGDTTPSAIALEANQDAVKEGSESDIQPQADAETTDLDLSADDTEDDEVDEDVESVGSEDALEEVPQRPRRRRRAYKIQEVIRRRQVILVQVVKEERGNKGAALTTYLSLAGRHTVLMPNTARGGGISRKITNPADRKRLRKIAGELEIPEGTGLIIRTAGASRTKAEIKRDYEYLLRLWENVRDLTMESTAPAVVYEEGDLIKRSIRDLYSKEIDEVLVAGDDSYKDAKTFMRMIMPSHAKNVKLYKDSEPLFIKHQIERQLNEMYSPYVTLPSGGYIVINQTEALVSIDVNSGKSTKEHSIEDTALRTNAEAAEEIARQLRLRDLAGLVVIDFIDMDERRNNRTVERKLKECLRNDRARIQVGRISHFGLLEMSRQRLRTGVLEGSTTQCPHCQGTGIIRSTDSVALSVLRALEDTLLAGELTDLSAITSVDVALYVLNQKRPYLKDIEARYGVNISIIADQKLQGANFQIERSEVTEGSKRDANVVVKVDWGFEPPETTAAKPEEDDGRKRRKRRRRRKERSSETSEAVEATTQLEVVHENGENQSAVEADDEKDNSERRARTRRRGRRGGRRHKSTHKSEELEVTAESSENSQSETSETEKPAPSGQSDDTPKGAKTADTENLDEDSKDTTRGRSRRRFPAGRRRTPRKRNDNQNDNVPQEADAAADETKGESEEKPKPRRSRSAKPAKQAEKVEAMAVETVSHASEDRGGKSSLNGSADKPSQPDVSEKATNENAPVRDASDAPARKGWWQKRAQ